MDSMPRDSLESNNGDTSATRRRPKASKRAEALLSFRAGRELLFQAVENRDSI